MFAIAGLGQFAHRQAQFNGICGLFKIESEITSETVSPEHHVVPSNETWMEIRLAVKADVPTLAQLFYDTVMAHGPEHYTAAQTAAWAASTLDAIAFEHFILGVQTYVAEVPTGIVGFGGLSSEGHIASLYVRQDCLGQGVGSAILQHLMVQAQRDRLPRLYAEASEFSLGLFQKYGFHQYDTEVVERYGIAFTRYLIEKSLPTNP